jgi:hypothetical protein
MFRRGGGGPEKKKVSEVSQGWRGRGARVKCGRVGGRERSGRWGPLLLNGTARLMWCSPPLADGLKHVETQGFAPSVLAAAHVRRCQKPPCAKPPRLGSAPARSPPNTTEPWYRAPAAAAARSGAGGTPMGCSQQRTCGVALRTGHAHPERRERKAKASKILLED